MINKDDLIDGEMYIPKDILKNVNNWDMFNVDDDIVRNYTNPYVRRPGVPLSGRPPQRKINS